MTEKPERTALYRVWGDGGALLYIGVSKDFGTRWKQHAKAQPWWDEMKRLTADQWFEFRSEAEAAEETAIKAERPKYNKRHLVPVAQRPRGAARPGREIAAAAPPAPSAPQQTVPYPYNLLSFRLREPDMTGIDLSTPDGRFKAAEAFGAYERQAREIRSVLDKRVASLRELERERDLDWAVPMLQRMTGRLESLIGDGMHLATGREALLRAARIFRESAAVMARIIEVTEVAIKALEDFDELGEAGDETPERGAA